MNTPAPVPFIDLQAQRARLGSRIDDAIAGVLAHGKFIMGPEVGELESQLAEFAGAKHAITCSSGTDALLMALMAWNVGPGDAVFVPTFTFASTAEVVALAGATPVFCDVLGDTFNMDPANLTDAIRAATDAGLNPKAVIPVDLFGQPADYNAIQAIAREHGLKVLADAAQSFGAELSGKPMGSIGDIAATSFFPAKPLGCYGDGGAVFTDDDDAATAMRSIRVHGKGSDKYDNARIGLNARLDTLQAAILIQKLAIFADEISARQRVAARYNDLLGNLSGVSAPTLMTGATSAWAQYTLRLEDRAAVQASLKADNIPAVVYYPLALHQQTAYSGFPTAAGGAPVSEALTQSVLSLPMHPYLDDATQDRIVAAVRAGVTG